ncbi:MAG: Tat pathway signal protein [Rhodococcus sp. (in: high G+C Gram-positive bacteria)]|uniref:Tat pathway signal protein n=1 Tax=Rhodococcus sp. TaxID=1831 RepID=UPI003BAEDD2F
MNRRHFGQRIVAGFAAAAAATMMFTGVASAEPADSAPTIGAPAIDTTSAIAKLRTVAAGNAEAEAAIERLAASPTDVALSDVALPGQIFQIPAYSDTGQGGPVLGQLYGAGVATNMNNEFRFGFFGGPGVIANDQAGAQLDVVYYSFATGASGIVKLDKNNIAVPTVISTPPIPGLGSGLVVAAVYGSLNHQVGDKVVKSTIWWPTLGTVLA